MLIDNYDVSYVDTLGLPASMEATLVPSTPATPGSGQYAWTGADQSTTDMQQSVANFTTNNTSVSTDPNSVNGLGTYFNGLGWDQFYLPPGNNATATDGIKQINNTIPDTPVTIITQNSTAGLQNGSAVKITGVTGQTDINGTWVISNLTPTSFALVGSVSEPSHNLPAAAPGRRFRLPVSTCRSWPPHRTPRPWRRTWIRHHRSIRPSSTW